MNNIIFFEQDRLQNPSRAYAIANHEKIDHLTTILKIKEGETYKAILIDKGLCKAECIKITKNKILFYLSQFSHGEKRHFDLLIGLSRPQSLKKILEYAAGQSIQKIYFYQAELSEKSYGSSKVFEEDKLREILIKGLSQCGRFQSLPRVEILNGLPLKVLANYQRKFILSPNATKTIFKNDSLVQENPALFAIGPERGFTEKELIHYKNQGFKEILLSRSVLRVEMAIISLCAQLELMELR